MSSSRRSKKPHNTQDYIKRGGKLLPRQLTFPWAESPEERKRRKRREYMRAYEANPENRKRIREHQLARFKERYASDSEFRATVRAQGDLARDRNREKYLAYARARAATEEEKARKRAWNYNNRETIRKLTAQRRQTNPYYRITDSLRARLNVALRLFRTTKKVSSVRDLGCTIEEFMYFIECKFKPGMTWENRGRTKGCWALDHVRPLASFDLNDVEQQRQAVHYTNYQPLWIEENSRKGASWNPHISGQCKDD